jgi:hypothetical protein
MRVLITVNFKNKIIKCNYHQTPYCRFNHVFCIAVNSNIHIYLEFVGVAHLANNKPAPLQCQQVFWESGECRCHPAKSFSFGGTKGLEKIKTPIRHSYYTYLSKIKKVINFG